MTTQLPPIRYKELYILQKDVVSTKYDTKLLKVPSKRSVIVQTHNVPDIGNFVNQLKDSLEKIIKRFLKNKSISFYGFKEDEQVTQQHVDSFNQIDLSKVTSFNSTLNCEVFISLFLKISNGEIDNGKSFNRYKNDKIFQELFYKFTYTKEKKDWIISFIDSLSSNNNLSPQPNDSFSFLFFLGLLSLYLKNDFSYIRSILNVFEDNISSEELEIIVRNLNCRLINSITEEDNIDNDNNNNNNNDNQKTLIFERLFIHEERLDGFSGIFSFFISTIQHYEDTVKLKSLLKNIIPKFLSGKPESFINKKLFIKRVQVSFHLYSRGIECTPIYLAHYLKESPYEFLTIMDQIIQNVETTKHIFKIVEKLLKNDHSAIVTLASCYKLLPFQWAILFKSLTIVERVRVFNSNIKDYNIKKLLIMVSSTLECAKISLYSKLKDDTLNKKVNIPLDNLYLSYKEFSTIEFEFQKDCPNQILSLDYYNYTWIVHESLALVASSAKGTDILSTYLDILEFDETLPMLILVNEINKNYNVFILESNFADKFIELGQFYKSKTHHWEDIKKSVSSKFEVVFEKLIEDYNEIKVDYSPDQRVKFENLTKTILKWKEYGLSNENSRRVVEFSAFIKKFDSKMNEFEQVYKLKEYLERKYSYHFNNNQMRNWPSSKKNKLLKRLITSSSSPNGHSIKQFETIKFLTYFEIENKSLFFPIIYDHYTKENGPTNIDLNTQKTSEFLERLIRSDSSMQLNEIFETITKLPEINYSKEITTIFKYFKPNEEYNTSIERNIQTFIDNAIFIYGVREHFPTIEKFMQDLKFLKISDFVEKREMCDKIINLVFKETPTVAQANSKLEELKKLICISKLQFEFFDLKIKDLMEWYSSFANKHSFDIQAESSSNNFSDAYSSQIINYTIFCRHQLEEFIEYNTKYLKDENNRTVITFKEFFEKINKIIPVESFNNSKVAFNNTINMLQNVKVLFKSGDVTEKGVIENSKIILNIASTFKSKVSSVIKSKNSWSVINDNLILTNEVLENNYRGLDLYLNVSNKETFDKFKFIFQLFVNIHQIQYQLYYICHPHYLVNHVVLVECSETSLTKLRDKLIRKVNKWRKFIDHLPKVLLLLRASGISALYSKLKSLYKDGKNYLNPDAERVTEEIYPFIKYCFSEVDLQYVHLLEEVKKNRFGGNIGTYLFELIKRIKTNIVGNYDEKDEEEEKERDKGKEFLNYYEPSKEQLEGDFNSISDDNNDFYGEEEQLISESASASGKVNTSFELVPIKNKSELYRYLMWLNEDVLPHPSQIFYSNTFSRDFLFFKKLVERFKDIKFFLIGTPDSKDELIEWMSLHFGKNSMSTLAKVFIISVEDDNYTKDVFSFIPLNTDTPTLSWENFKAVWKERTKPKSIESLSLVYDKNSTGKTFFIKKKIPVEPETVFIRPGFKTDSIFEKLKKKNIKDMYIHFNISCYADFEEFSQFFYPFITYGYIFKKNGELTSVPPNCSIKIYVEIGEPLDSNPLKEDLKKYVENSIPLIYHLATICSKNQSDNQSNEYKNMQWEASEPENRAFSFVNCSFYQKATIDTHSYPFNYTEYLHYLKRFISEKYLKLDIGYLEDPNCFPFRKNFFSMLNERLKFLDSYYEYYLMICDYDYQTPNSKLQDGLLSYQELYEVFLIESIQLADPKYSSATNWDKPPLITNRSTIKVSNSQQRYDSFQSRAIDFIHFSDTFEHQIHRRIKSLPSYITLSSAKQDSSIFNSKIATSFGIHSRTNIVGDLAKQYGFVLTPELSLRLLILNNRIQHHRALVLTGDTGVGKTMLLIFYSLLINAGLSSIPDIIFEIKELIINFGKSISEFNQTELFKNLSKNYSIENIIKVAEEIFRFSPKIDDKDNLSSSSSGINSLNNSDSSISLSTETKIKLINQSISSGLSLPYESSLKHQSLFIKKLEETIISIVEKYTLIDIQPDGYIQRLLNARKQNIKELNFANTIELIREVCSVSFKNIFYRIIMNKKFSSKLFKKEVKSIIAESVQLKKIDTNLKMVVFIDEFNTSPEDTLALISEIFTDNSFDGDSFNGYPFEGKKIKIDNIFWIGAMNPLNHNNSNILNINSSKKDIDYTGEESLKVKSDFVVLETPPSLKQFFLDYGTLSSNTESSFCHGLLKLKKKVIIPSFIRDLEKKAIINQVKAEINTMIIIGQEELRKSLQVRTHVSFRDIVRAIDLYILFTGEIGTEIFKTIDVNITENPYKRHWLALICSFSMAYLYRLNLDNRKSMLEKINHFINSSPSSSHLINNNNNGNNNNRIDITEIFSSICSGVGSQTTISKGIAATESLKLNIFFTLVSIYSCIPLCIVGPPGCSKTLSFSIVNDCFNKHKHTPIYSFIKSSQPFRYQCNNHTTDTEIKEILEKAITRASIIPDSRMIVHLDEAGLVDEESSPMKIMHDYLDKGTRSKTLISIIILSNRILDAAKTNRMLLLVHPKEISTEDERELVSGCLFGVNSISKLKPEQIEICNNICLGFKSISEGKVNFLHKIFPNIQNQKDLFHQRDFVFFLRHLKISYDREKKITEEALLNSLERNFIGTKYFPLHAQAFFMAFGFDEKKIIEKDNTVQRILENLQEKIDIEKDEINTLGFRYMMLLDPTENETSLLILKELGIEHSVIRVGDFENDQTSDNISYIINEMKNKMSKGGVVVLVNSQPIQACFYDVFNRHFSIFQNEDKKLFLSHLSYGTNTIFSPVHPDFKVIVHLPLSKLEKTQLPWLNRFEKYILGIDQLLAYKLDNSSNKEFYLNLLKSGKQFVKTVNENDSLFFGYSKKSTIGSLVYQALIQESSFGPYTNFIQDKQFNKQTLYPSTLLNWKLLQIAKPESLHKCGNLLSKSYKEEYLVNQEHFNAFLFIESLIKEFFSINNGNNNNPTPIKSKWTIFTRTSFYLHNIKGDFSNSNITDVLVSKINLSENPLFSKIQNTSLLFKVIKLQDFKSSIQCRNEIDEFFSRPECFVLIVVVDMMVVTNNQINLVHELFDEFSKGELNRLLIFICHFPPEYTISPQNNINSIFLNNNNFIYIDSLGIKIEDLSFENKKSKVASDVKLNVSKFVFKSFGLEKNNESINEEEFLKEMFFIFLRQISKTMISPFIPITAKPIVREFYSTPSKRYERLEELFKKHDSWVKSIINQFLKTWNESKFISDIISEVSNTISSSSQSFLDSIKSSIKCYFYPVISQILRVLVNYFSFESIALIKDEDQDQIEMIKNYISSVNSLKIPDSIEERLKPITILPPPIKDITSNLPLYDSISNSITQLFDQALASIQVRSIINLSKKFHSIIADHPIKLVIDHIKDHPSLLEKFQTDYIVRTLKFENSISRFFFNLIDTLKNKVHSNYNHPILDLWIVSYFENSTLNLLKNILLPLINLSDVNLVEELVKLKFNANDLHEYQLFIEEFSFNLLHKRLLVLLDKAEKERYFPTDSFINWIKVVREVFNISGGFTKTILDFKSVKDHSSIERISFIFVVYSILLDTSSNNQNPESLQSITKLLNNSLKKNNGPLEFSDFKKLFIFLFNFRNEKERELDQLGFNNCLQNDCILDILESVISINNENFISFIDICLNPKQNHFFPIGWSCIVIYDYIKRNNSNLDSLRIIINDRIITTLNNEFSFHPPFVVPPSPQCLKFFSMPVINNNSSNNNNIEFKVLEDSLYFSLLKNIEEEEIDELIIKRETESKSNQPFNKIYLESINIRIIELFAGSLNSDQNYYNNVLKQNELYKDTIKSIFTIPENSSAKVIRLINIHKATFINNLDEKILDLTLKNSIFLESIGLSSLVIEDNSKDSKSTIDYNQLPCVYNPKDPFYEHYRYIEKFLHSSPTPNFTEIQDNYATPELQGIVRVSLFLILYQDYIDNVDLKPFKYLLESEEQKSFLKFFEIDLFIEFFQVILYDKLNDEIGVHKIIKRDPNKTREETIASFITINSTAMSMGSSSNTYLFNITRNIQTIAGQYFPACDVGNIFRDCAMIYLDEAEDNTVTMGYNTLYKYIVSSTSWSAFTFYISINESFTEYLLKPQIHFVSKLENRSHVSLTNYLWDRALTSISEISRNPDIVSQHIETGHLVSEFLFDIWKQGYRNTNSKLGQYLKSHFTSVHQVLSYERYLCTVITALIKDYPKRKQLLREVYDQKSAMSSKSKDVKSIINSLREDFVTSYPRPYFTFEKINSVLCSSTDLNSFEVLKFMSNQIQKICVSKYFSKLINFIKKFYEVFRFRLKENQFNYNFKQCIELLKENHNIKSSNNNQDKSNNQIQNNNQHHQQQKQTIPQDILELENAWEQCKEAWSNITKEMNIIEGGCAQRPEYEKVAYPITDYTPMSFLFFDSNSNGAGLFLNLINGWVSHTQAPCLELKNNFEMTDIFRDITDGFITKNSTYDLADLPTDGTNYYLLGADFEPNDYHEYIYHLFSHYQNFDRSKMQPNFKTIQNKVITRFFAGKGIANVLKTYSTRFPFLKDVEVNSLTNKLQSIPTDYLSSNIIIKNLFEITCKLKDYDIDISPPLKSHLNIFFKKLKERSNDFADLLTRTIANLVERTNIADQQQQQKPQDQHQEFFSITKLDGKITLIEISKDFSRFIGDLSNKILLEQIGTLSYIFLVFITKELSLYNNIKIKLVDYNLLKTFDDLYNYIVNFVETRAMYKYLKEVHSILVSKDTVKELSIGIQKKETLYSIVSKQLANVTNKSIIPVHLLCSPNTPLNYYPILMRTIHKSINILENRIAEENKSSNKEYKESFTKYFHEKATLYNYNSNNDNDNILEYRETFKTTFNQKDEENLDRKLEILRLKALEHVVSDDEDDDDLIIPFNAEGKEISNRIITPITKSNNTIITASHHYVYYWLRSLSQFNKFVNTSPKSKSNMNELFISFNSFKEECYKESKDPINLNDLDEKMFNQYQPSSIFEVFTHVVHKLAIIDPEIKHLFFWSIKKANNNNFEYNDIVGIYKDWKSNNNGNIKDLIISNVNVENIVQIKSPEYIIIGVDRPSDGSPKLCLENGIDISNISENSIYDIQSIVYKNAFGFSLIINNGSKNDVFSKDRTSQVGSLTEPILDTMGKNCMLVCLKKRSLEANTIQATKEQLEQERINKQLQETNFNPNSQIKPSVESEKQPIVNTIQETTLKETIKSTQESVTIQDTASTHETSIITQESTNNSKETIKITSVIVQEYVTPQESPAAKETVKEIPESVKDQTIQQQQPNNQQSPSPPAQQQEQSIQSPQTLNSPPPSPSPVQQQYQTPPATLYNSLPLKNHKILYDRELFKQFLKEFGKLNNDQQNIIIENGVDCYSALLNMNSDDWKQFSFIKDPIKKSITNKIRNLVHPLNHLYQFESYELNDVKCFREFVFDIFGNEEFVDKLIDEGYEDFSCTVDDNDDYSDLTEFLGEFLKSITISNFIIQLKHFNKSKFK